MKIETNRANRDIEEKSGEPERDFQDKDFEEVLKARDELLEGLSHDLKNALSSILMNTSLARRVVPEKDECMLQMIERIQDASDRIRMAMQDALDMTNCVSGSLAICPARREMRVLVTDALAQVESQKNAKKITVQVSGSNEGLSVVADHEKVPTALARLIAFGIKISPASSPIEVRIEESDEDVLFRMQLVPGIITTEQLQHVFDRQGKKPGLYLVRGIAEAFGGHVWATSKENGGAELGVSLKGVERDNKVRLSVQS